MAVFGGFDLAGNKRPRWGIVKDSFDLETSSHIGYNECSLKVHPEFTLNGPDVMSAVHYHRIETYHEE